MEGSASHRSFLPGLASWEPSMRVHLQCLACNSGTRARDAAMIAAHFAASRRALRRTFADRSTAYAAWVLGGSPLFTEAIAHVSAECFALLPEPSRRGLERDSRWSNAVLL